jgi:prefoldin alpha subunit
MIVKMAEKEKSKDKENKEKKAQELYMQLNMTNQQMQEFQKQTQGLEETIQEVTESMRSLDELGKSEKDKEILVPLVSGIFVKAELKDIKEFIVNIGAGVAVAKSLEEVKGLLNKQIVELQKTQDKMMGELQQLVVKAKTLEKELKSLMENV